MKKLLSLFVAIVMVLQIFPVISFASGTVTITGPSEVRATPHDGETNYVPYVAKLDGADATFVWSVSGGSNVSIDPKTGNLAVTKASSGTVTVTATLASDPTVTASKSVWIGSSFVATFDNVDITEYFSSGTEIGTETSGNKYAVAKSGTRGVSNNYNTKLGRYITGRSDYTSYTFETDVRFDIDGIIVYFIGDRQWWFYLSSVSNGDGTYHLRYYNGAWIDISSTSFNQGAWASLKVEVDRVKNTLLIYVEDQLVASDVPSTKVAYDYLYPQFLYLNTDNEEVTPPIDNVVCYTGTSVAHKVPIKIDTDKPAIYVPHTGYTTNMQLSVNNDGPITWALGGEYSGVSVNASTGLITATSAAARGTIMVLAKDESGNTIATKTIEIKNINGFNASFPNTELTTFEGENVLKLTSGRSDLVIPQGEIYGKYIIKAKLYEDTTGPDLASTTYSQSAWHMETIVRNANEWVDYEVYVDTVARTYTAVVNGSVYNGYVGSPFYVQADRTSETFDVKSFIIKADYMKDFSLTMVGEGTAPKAFNVNVTSAKVGYPLSGEYLYLSPLNQAESCSVIKFMIETAKGSNTYTDVGESYTPTVADEGKKVKFVVQPNVDSLQGSMVESAAVVITKDYGYTTEYVNIVNGDAVGNSIVSGGRIKSVNITKTSVAGAAKVYVGLYDSASCSELLGIAEADIPADLSVGASSEYVLNKEIAIEKENVDGLYVKVIIVNNELSPLAKAYNLTTATKDLIIMGDSIYAAYEESNDRKGIGMVIDDYLTDNVNVINKAVSGYSTKNYLDNDEQKWLEVKNLLGEGDTLLISLAINDAGQAIEYSQYMTNYGKFITEAKAKGAEVIVSTSTVTMYNDSVIIPSYRAISVKAMEAAETYGAYCVDLNKAVYNDFVKNGDITAIRKAYYLWNWTTPDYTHLSLGGANYYARMLTNLINSTDADLANYIK